MKIAGLDIGSTGCKFVVFDGEGNYLGKAYRDYPVRRKVGGHEVDAAALIEVFDGMKVQFRFWYSDEEFGPQLSLLWDRNVLQYMHYETVWFASCVLIGRICRALER